MRNTEGTFWEHLEELRKRLFIMLIMLFCTTAAGFVFSRKLMNLVLITGPAVLQTLAPSEAVVAHLKLSLMAGILVSSPVLFFQFWRFVSPGLYPSEKKAVIGIALFSSLLFMAGAAFAWIVMLEPALQLFHSFETGSIEGHWSLSAYIGFLGRFILVFGLAFQMPLMILGLTRLGVITPSGLRRYRSHVIVGLLILAALLTPPDPVTQVLLALPLYLLFELSLLAASILTGRHRERHEDNNGKAASG
jgi:sec-independent protein translocase protein TatC